MIRSMRTLPLIGLAALFITGCGTMIKGDLLAVQSGTVMDFQIERSHGTGDMTAYNPETGEAFEGRYTGSYQGGGVAVTNSTGSFSGSSRDTSSGTMYRHSGNVSGSSTTFVPPSNATARGFLRGDQGTVITLYMDIRPGIMPKGHGEGVDQDGNRYQVQF
ncbi:hypothetical protein D5687_09515 [Guyparkeria sp. SCN-R1]|uniref:hypothetical protein n=1 Tax=Guyparkeria sp. SCN-R1 TaxID=2341113 RepID=UPI000F656074|nr:hypothetical protein [Guyparkeria sp. SCN-R1]RRQ20408.1 hypothetical protein D5687_09515 [Guyparkeria sp. SCN-R1]